MNPSRLTATCLLTLTIGLVQGFCLSVAAVESDTSDRSLFPFVGTGYELDVSLYARDPLVRNPCALTIDKKGRLLVGMGPQYRKPRPDTPGDSVYILEDTDGDGIADSRKIFATGFNCIQGLLCSEDGVYVANAPDFTLVRDTDGDDVGDIYIKLYSDLGNLEHGLHGLNWGPDGKLYMSKGNSKGLSIPPDRIAPRPFRDLWGVELPGVPDFPLPEVYSANNYVNDYHDPDDDWGRQGGVLRCDPDGSNLEVVAAGMRNPWDMAADSSFNWLATDNDQNLGDKFISPFFGAHFGWGHVWSSDWVGENHYPSVPASGPLFEGSGTGVTWWDVNGLPPELSQVFIVNDWLRREVLVYRPVWDGALMKTSTQPVPVLAYAGSGRDMKSSDGRSFDPVDIEVGPDGALYISSWGREYGANIVDEVQVNEGRIYRLMPTRHQVKPAASDFPSSNELSRWSPGQIIQRMEAEWLPVRLKILQDSLVSQWSGTSVSTIPDLSDLSVRTQTWVIHGLARSGHISLIERELRENFSIEVADQVLKALRRSDMRSVISFVKFMVHHPESRLRHQAVTAIHRTGFKALSRELLSRLETESDRVVYFSLWKCLSRMDVTDELVASLSHSGVGRRRGAALALMENGQISEGQARALRLDPDPSIAALAAKWLDGGDEAIIKGPPLPSVAELSEEQTPSDSGQSDISLESLPEVKLNNSLGSVGWTRARKGAATYTDRNYSIRRLPDFVDGMALLQTANEDDRNTRFGISLDLDQPRRVYVARDERLPRTRRPEWMREWHSTGERILTDDSAFELFFLDVPAGELHLGPNMEAGGQEARYGFAQYFVIVEVDRQSDGPVAVVETTRSEDVVKFMESANADRGRALFLSSDGAACATCHQMEGIGNAFAPDLSDIGSRAGVPFIIESILNPDAAITEGFRQVAISTLGGDVHAGMVLSESGRAVRMALLNGDVVSISRDQIDDRQTLDHSAMPGHFAQLLTPTEVADITTYLSTRKNAMVSASIPEENIELSEGPWKVEAQSESMSVQYDDSEIATYIWRHESMSRPGFANIRSRRGEPVTRSFPAAEEADHRFMHPGLSMSFGWLDGEDFWRMKAPVEHILFTVPPRVVDDSLEFEVKNRYLSADRSRTVCLELARYRITLDGELIRMNWSSRFYNDEASFEFGDQEESGLALRIATDLNVRSGNGRIISSHGGINEKGTWGKEFDWIEYSGERQGRRIGIGIRPSATNPRRCWSHSRDYGVLVANPFPRQPKGQREPIVRTPVKQFQPYTLEYEIVIFDLDSNQDTGADLFLNLNE